MTKVQTMTPTIQRTAKRDACDRVESLFAMLAYRRPAGSKTERAFIRRFISPLGVQIDSYGNLYRRIGNAPILWSCHTDTVHRQGGQQSIKHAGHGIVALGKAEKQSNCLGADCTVGVWIMCEMMKAGVEGLYIFHREEESGGLGSGFIASKTPYRLDGIEYAIAFDRRGESSVITHQSGMRCCSDKFALALAKHFERHGMRYALDDGGTFTDTAQYTDLVGECSNVSVGFDCEHSARETLNVPHALALLDSICKLDVSTLPRERNAGDVEDLYSVNWLQRDPMPWDWPESDLGDWTPSHDNDSLEDMIAANPHIVADILAEYGLDARSLAGEIRFRRGDR